MKYTVIFTARADGQLDAIRVYIASAADSVIAERYVNAIIDHCRDLDMFPNRGTRRDDVYAGLRTINFRKRVTIAFVVDDDARLVTIMGVFYGGQDLDASLVSGDDGD